MKRGTRKIEIVRPATSRRETTHVVRFAVLVLAVAAGLLAVRGESGAEGELARHQISAYHDLSTIEQGTYNDLLAASVDIDALHAGTLSWPTVSELESLHLPPFVRDRAWQERGKLQWSQHSPDSRSQHAVTYMGFTMDADTSGSFLLWMTHTHAADPLAAASAKTGPTHGAAPGFKPEITVWYHPDGATGTLPVFRQQDLIADGWREVVMYSGEDELQRLKGAGGE